MGSLFKQNNTGVDIADMTQGVSKAGMQTYIDSLKISLLDEVKSKLEDVGAIQTAVDAGWQGKSRDKFFEMFEKSINEIEDDLEAEFKDLNGRLNELANNYYSQDNDLLQ